MSLWHISVFWIASPQYWVSIVAIFATKPCFSWGLKAIYCVYSQKFLLFPINSHAIHKSKMRTGIKRGDKDPERTPKSGFIQAPLSSNQEIRRAGEQTSPQVARAAGHPARRDEGGGLISGSRSIRRFPSRGSQHDTGTGRDQQGSGTQVQRRKRPQGRR